MLVFEARTGTEIARLLIAEPVRAVGFSRDGSLLAMGSGSGDDGIAHVFAVRLLERTGQGGPSEPGRCHCIQPGRHAARDGLAGRSRRLRGGGERQASADGDERLCPFGRLQSRRNAVPRGIFEEARLFEAPAGREVARLIGGASPAVFSPDGALVAAGSADQARVFYARTGREAATLGRPGRAVAFSADGKLVVTDNGIFDASTGQESAGLPTGVGLQPRWPADGAATLGTAGALVFEAHLERHVARLAHNQPVEALAFSPDGEIAASRLGSVRGGGPGGNCSRSITSRRSMRSSSAPNRGPCGCQFN